MNNLKNTDCTILYTHYVFFIKFKKTPNTHSPFLFAYKFMENDVIIHSQAVFVINYIFILVIIC